MQISSLEFEPYKTKVLEDWGAEQPPNFMFILLSGKVVYEKIIKNA